MRFPALMLKAPSPECLLTPQASRPDARPGRATQGQVVGRAGGELACEGLVPGGAHVPGVDVIALQQWVVGEEDLAVVAFGLGRVERHENERVLQVCPFGFTQRRSRDAVVVAVLRDLERERLRG